MIHPHGIGLFHFDLNRCAGLLGPYLQQIHPRREPEFPHDAPRVFPFVLMLPRIFLLEKVFHLNRRLDQG